MSNPQDKAFVALRDKLISTIETLTSETVNGPDQRIKMQEAVAHYTLGVMAITSPSHNRQELPGIDELIRHIFAEVANGRNRCRMNAQDLIEKLRVAGSQEPHVIFYLLAEHAGTAQLADGQYLRDATDFVAWLRELAEAAKIHGYPNNGSHDHPDTDLSGGAILIRTRPHPQSRWDDTCPRCGHVHQGDKECGEQMGGGGICRCEMDVPA